MGWQDAPIVEDSPSWRDAPLANALPSVRAKTDELDKKLREEGGGGFLGFMGDINRSAEQLKNAGPWTKGGREGMKDAFGNLWEGTKEAVGQGDRSTVPAERARQAELYAKEPGYAQAKEFWNVAGNPISYIPAATVPRAVASGAAIMGLQPAENATEQAWNAIKGGLTGGAMSTVAKTFTPGIPNNPTIPDFVHEAVQAVGSVVPGTQKASAIMRALRWADNLKTPENLSPYAIALVDRLRKVAGQSTGAFEDINAQSGNRYQYTGP
jgi:hypothetical protein